MIGAALWFPWLDHFTLREADAMERAREKYRDACLSTHKFAEVMGKTRDEIDAYLTRNPRKPKDAA